MSRISAFTFVFALAFLAGALPSVFSVDPLFLPLNRFPFVMTHDAGTGYLKPEDLVDDVVYAWTKTQNVNVTEQLNCGARAFDWRPQFNGSLLGFHHGPVFVPHAMSDAVQELVVWADANADAKEDSLIVVTVSHDDCDDKVISVFNSFGIPVHRYGDGGASCGENITVAQALEYGRRTGGPGSIFVTLACDQYSPPNFPPIYNDQIECSGFLNATEGDVWRNEMTNCLQKTPNLLQCIEALGGILNFPSHYSCYNTSSIVDKTYAYDRLISWDQSVTNIAPPPPPNAFLYSIMGCWSQNIESTVFGFLSASSLILDEERSGLNYYLADSVKNGTFKYIPNMIGVNNVCNGGGALKDALRSAIQKQN